MLEGLEGGFYRIEISRFAVKLMSGFCDIININLIGYKLIMLVCALKIKFLLGFVSG